MEALPLQICDCLARNNLYVCAACGRTIFRQVLSSIWLHGCIAEQALFVRTFEFRHEVEIRINGAAAALSQQSASCTVQTYGHGSDLVGREGSPTPTPFALNGKFFAMCSETAA